jgi:uncharacterized protein (DUF952 family)
MTGTPPEIIWHITIDGTPALMGDEGFVHASFTSQLRETLAVHYPDAQQVVLLRLDRSALGDRLVIEASRGGALFPHVYGEIADRDVVEKVELARAASGRFPLEGLPETE